VKANSRFGSQASIVHTDQYTGPSPLRFTCLMSLINGQICSGLACM
jgi:hypothetical protein